MPLESQPTQEALLSHADFLRGLARGLLAGADADDLEQETWLRALEKGPRHDANLKGWLATVARNTARLMHRGESRRARREGAVARPEGIPSAAEVASRVEIQSLLANAVKSLEEPYRTTVVLAFYDGLKPAEIAKKQGVPIDTVRTRQRRALQRLRAALDDEPGGRPAWVAALMPLAWPKGAAAAVTGALVMTTRWKIALVIALLIPTAWLGHQAWRGHADRGPDRAVVADRGGADLPEGVPFEAPKAGPDGVPLSPIPVDEAPARFAARIVADGRPLAGAWVLVDGEGAEMREFHATGPDGIVRTAHEKNIEVRAWHPDRSPATLRVPQAREGEVVDLELPPGTNVPIDVIDDRTGTGVEGAWIHVLQAGGGERARYTNAGLEESLGREEDLPKLLPAISIEDLLVQSQAGKGGFRVAPLRTDELGRAWLRGMPAGTFEAIVVHDGYVARRIRRAPVGTEPVRIRVQVGATLEVHAPSVRGRPGRGLVCEVKRGGMLPMPVAIGTLDDEGSARFEHLPTGTFGVVVSSGGSGTFVLGLGSVAAPPDEDPAAEAEEPAGEPVKAIFRMVDLRNGETAVVRFADASGTRLFGCVRNAAGPVAERVIWLHRGSEKIGETQTDAAGRYSFDQLEPGAYELRADIDTAVLIEKAFSIEPGQEELELDLEPAAGVVLGSVIGTDGKRLANCEVVLSRAFDAPEPELERGGEAAILFALRGRAQTDEEGRYRIEGVADGEYRLLAGYAGRLAQRRLRVSNGEAVALDIDFGRERAHAVRVTFVDPEGEPIRAALLLRGEHNEFAEAYALGVQLEGRAEFTYHLPPGRYRLTACAAGFAAVQGEYLEVKGDRELTLEFREGVDFELDVRRDGRPWAGARVELIQENGIALGPARSLLSIVQALREWTADDDGKVAIPAAPPGRYRLRLDGRNAGEITIRKDRPSEQIEATTR